MSLLKTEVWIYFEISCQALQCDHMALGRVFLVGNELRGGSGDLVSDCICDKASYEEGGLVLAMLGGGVGGLVGFAARHIVAGALWSVNWF